MKIESDMANHVKTFVSFVGLISVISGCVNLKAPPDPTRYYLLNGSSSADSLGLVTIIKASGPTMRLAPIDLDPYLDSRFMVVRLQENEVQFSDIHRWGEELAGNIRRALAEELLNTGGVSSVSTASSDETDYVVRVHIRRFEGVPPDIAHLSATWQLDDASGNELYSSQHDDMNAGWVYGDYGHLARKLDESLATLAMNIAEHLSH